MVATAVRPHRGVTRLSVLLAALTLIALTACAPEVAPAPPQILRAPSSVAAVAGDGEAEVTWVAPGINSSTRIDGYTIYSSEGDTWEVEGVALRFTAAGLTNGTTYTFTVTANNANGPSPESEPSNEVTPQAG